MASTKKKSKKSKAVKGKNAKKATKKKNAKPISGQSGPKIQLLPLEKMNDKERAVYQAVARNKKISLEDIAAKCFANKGKKSNSWARNSLRRLVRAGLVKKIGRGEYAIGKQAVHAKAEPAKKTSKSKTKTAKKTKKTKAKAAPKKATKKPTAKKKAKAKPNGMIASAPSAPPSLTESSVE